MTFSTLIRRSLQFHARAHLGVVLGAAVSGAALIGALIVGDSVRESLRQHALRRLQNIHYAMVTGDRFFRQDLGQRLERVAEGNFNPSELRPPSQQVALTASGNAT